MQYHGGAREGFGRFGQICANFAVAICLVYIIVYIMQLGVSSYNGLQACHCHTVKMSVLLPIQIAGSQAGRSRKSLLVPDNLPNCLFRLAYFGTGRTTSGP